MEEIVQREKMDVHDQYVKAARKRKTMTFAGLAFLIAIEGFATYGMHKTVDSENLQNRVFREYDIRSKGQIETAKGIYFGDTDFGYFSGNGKFAFNTKTEYSGQWSENQFEGKGSLHVPDHGVYEGEFSESLKMEKERLPGMIKRFMKVNGKKIRWTVQENTLRQMVLFIRECLEKIRFSTERANLKTIPEVMI